MSLDMRTNDKRLIPVTPRPYLLLDRDGTLIQECHYLSDPEKVVLLPGVIEGLRRFRALGYGLLVITNQSGIGRGYFGLDDYEQVTGRMHQLLEREGLSLDGVYFCPHAPDEGCQCRKPRTGLVERAARDLGFDPKTSVVIGDKLSDMELARNAGCFSILVRTGYGREAEKEGPEIWDFAADDLPEAAMIIENEICKGERA